MDELGTFEIGDVQIGRGSFFGAAGLAVDVPVSAQSASANVRFLSRVGVQMPLEVEGMIETLAANVTTERSFARMNPKIGIEVGQLAARLGADDALKVLHSVYLLHCVR